MRISTKQVLAAVKAYKCGRSAWSKGVKELAIMIAETPLEWDDECFDTTNFAETQKYYLNGAETIAEYCDGGCLLIYDEDIAKCLCSPSEFRKFEKRGFPDPNKTENWMQVQVRAAKQALRIVNRCVFMIYDRETA